MNTKILFVLLFISSTIYAQDSIVKKDTLVSNIVGIFSIRSPRIETCNFDYLLGHSLDMKYKKTSLSYNISFERQNDIIYLSHQEKIDFSVFKNFSCQVQDYLDEDKTIHFSNISLYYEKKYFKIGLCESYEYYKKTNYTNIYLSFKYKFISIESFLSNNEYANKIMININPQIRAYKDLYIGIKGNYLYSNLKYSYQLLMSLNLKLNRSL